MNGWANRATWLWGMYYSNWLEDNAETIAERAKDSWGNPEHETEESYTDDLKNCVYDAIVDVLGEDIESLKEQAKESLGTNSFLSDAIDVDRILDGIDVKELSGHYIDDWFDSHNDYQKTYPIADTSSIK